MIKMTVGLFGGSFDPPHSGHLYISMQAKKRLSCQQIWWLVAKQNPFKNESSDFYSRCLKAQHCVNNYGIKVLEIERSLQRAKTHDVLTILKNRFPHCHFIWIMGADNLQHFNRWHRAKDICDMLPIAIFDRPRHTYIGLKSKFWQSQNYRYVSDPRLLRSRKDGWHFFRLKLNNESSTQLRKKNSVID